MRLRRCGGASRRFAQRQAAHGRRWQSRFKSSVPHRAYLLSGCRYSECNPLEEGKVNPPWEYR
jgi:hypothetical protein